MAGLGAGSANAGSAAGTFPQAGGAAAAAPAGGAAAAAPGAGGGAARVLYAGLVLGRCSGVFLVLESALDDLGLGATPGALNPLDVLIKGY